MAMIEPSHTREQRFGAWREEVINDLVHMSDEMIAMSNEMLAMSIECCNLKRDIASLNKADVPEPDNRQSGCEYCTAWYDEDGHWYTKLLMEADRRYPCGERGESGGTEATDMHFEVFVDPESRKIYFTKDKFVVDGKDIAFCPMCGRRLEDG